MKPTTDQIVPTITSTRSTSDGREERDTAPRSLLVPTLGIFVVNLLLRVFYLRYQFVNGDEAVRALTALGVLRGERLYLDIITDKPPGTTLFYAAVLSVFNHSMPAVHIAAAIWTFAAAIAIYVLGALVYSRKTGLWAALLFVYFAASYHTQDSMAANTELLMVLPYVLSYYCYLRGSPGASTTRPASGRDSNSSPELAAAGIRGSNNEWAWLLAAGLLAGIAALFKQVGLLLLGFFVLNELVRAIVAVPGGRLPERDGDTASQDMRDSRTRNDSGPHESWRLRASVRRLTFIAIGVLFVFAALIAWLWTNGVLFGFWRNAIQLGGFYIGSLPARTWF